MNAPENWQEKWLELNARLETIEQQRNDALANHAIAAGRLAVESAARHAAEAKAKGLEKRVGDLEAKVLELTAKVQELQPRETEA